jgi:hypothetical protein
MKWKSDWMEVGMKKVVLFLIGIAGTLILCCVIGAVSGLCPPQGPWPLPPWCEGSTISWPFTSNENPTPASTQITDEIVEEAPEALPPEVGIAQVTQEIISDLSLIQEYFDQGLTGMSAFTPEVNMGMGFSATLKGAHFACLTPVTQHGPSNIPPGFTAPLGASGFIGAPAGACAAGADPQAQFQDADGNAITAEKLVEENVTVIDYETLTGENPDIESLEQILTESIVPGDPALTTPDGWNEKVWEPLKAIQTPMESLMDYQLWNASDEIEDLVTSSMLDRMLEMGLPDMVLNAFQQSDHQGWFASRFAEEGDELAAMYIVAEFNGDLKGTIEETRTFHIPIVGELPEFGVMTGNGTVEFDHPVLGHIVFDVELQWTEWDEIGRVNGGSMSLIDQAGIYAIQFVFQPDGTKEGELYVDGELAGVVTLDVEGTSTYLDIQQDQTFPMDELSGK